MGEMTEEHHENVKIDATEWRRMDLMPPSQPGVEVIRGSHRDAFDRRMEAQYVNDHVSWNPRLIRTSAAAGAKAAALRSSR
jgi:hypothetical protein